MNKQLPTILLTVLMLALFGYFIRSATQIESRQQIESLKSQLAEAQKQRDESAGQAQLYLNRFNSICEVSFHAISRANNPEISKACDAAFDTIGGQSEWVRKRTKRLPK